MTVHICSTQSSVPDYYFARIAPLSPPCRPQTSDSFSKFVTDSSKSIRWFFWMIGIVLIIAGSAKLWLLITDTYADVKIGLPREILWVSLAFDIVLGIENLLIRNRRMLAIVDVAVFSVCGIRHCPLIDGI
jgi:hypothetical protein